LFASASVRQFNFLHEICEESHALFAVGEGRGLVDTADERKMKAGLQGARETHPRAARELHVVPCVKDSAGRRLHSPDADRAARRTREAFGTHQNPPAIGGPACSAGVPAATLQRLLPPEIAGLVLNESLGRVDLRASAHWAAITRSIE